ncbi:hypothetical protein FQR65_LT09502 [Abscondita terminalis]|nr:hypothetical protein FQR65_LT09502 [Abscondita terminalis]
MILLQQFYVESIVLSLGRNKNLVKVNKQTNIGNQVCNDEEKPTKCVSVPIKVNTVNITDDSIQLNDTNKLDCSAANSNVDMNSELYLNEYKWTDVVNKKRKKSNNVGNSYQSKDGVAPENKNFIKNKTIRGSASWADDNFCAEPRKLLLDIMVNIGTRNGRDHYRNSKYLLENSFINFLLFETTEN